MNNQYLSPASCDLTPCECCGNYAENCDTSTCAECGKLICPDCTIIYEGRVLCDSCAEIAQLDAEMDDEEMEEIIHGQIQY
jgi:hypothetical protein